MLHDLDGGWITWRLGAGEFFLEGHSSKQSGQVAAPFPGDLIFDALMFWLDFRVRVDAVPPLSGCAHPPGSPARKNYGEEGLPKIPSQTLSAAALARSCQCVILRNPAQAVYVPASACDARGTSSSHLLVKHILLVNVPPATAAVLWSANMPNQVIPLATNSWV